MKVTTSSPFMNGCKGCVSLTFDDGTPSQLEIAIPALAETELCGTFYLQPSGENWRERLSPWCAVAEAGHEIGNHSLSHICSSALFPNQVKLRSLESMTLADIEKDVTEAERRLNELFPVTHGRSFCYPCYQEHVGVGNNRKSYVPVIAKYFIAGRTRGEFGVNYPATCDIHCLWSWNAEGMDLFELIGRVEQAIYNKQWCIFTFHGIDNGGRLSVSRYNFGELLKYLASNSSRVWVDTLANVADRVIKWRKARRDEENSEDNDNYS